MFKTSFKEVLLHKSSQKLPVILVDIDNSQSLTTMFLANTGSRFETKDEEGLAHFFEHMVFKGTEKYPNAKKLAETLDSVGADFNAFTSKEYTGYYVRSAASNFSLALDVLSDMLFRPKLSQSDIDREKGVIIEELNMYRDNPSAHIADVFEEMIFKDRKLAHQIIGRKESIRSFTSQDFKNFLKKFYGPENLLLVIAGGIKALKKTEKELLAEIEAAVAKLEDERVDHKVAVPKLKSASASQIGQKSFSKEKFRLVNRPTEQAHFVMAWPALDTNHKDRYVLQVLSALIGGNMSSRLFTKVREERGLAYYVHSDLDFFHDAGLFGCSAGVDRSRAEEAIEVSKEGQVFGMKKLLRDEEVSVEEALKEIESVTIDDLMRVAKEIIREDELRLAIIGDFKNEEKLRKAMS